MSHLPFHSELPLEKQYKARAVKVESGAIQGSGCFFQPVSKAYTYVLTAKHCLFSEEHPLHAHQVWVHPHAGEPLQPEQIIWHPTEDVAILVMPYQPQLPDCGVMEPQKGMQVHVYGFPHKLRGKGEERESVQGEIAFCHEADFELSFRFLQFTQHTGVPENLVGLSGAGVFVEARNQLFLTGIFSRLKATDGVYNKYVACNLQLLEDILKAHQLCPLSVDHTGQIWQDPTLLNQVFYLAYTPDSAPYYLHRSVDEFFQNWLGSSKHLWVNGVSGVGKTNLVLRNLTLLKRPYLFIDLSTLTGKEVAAHFEYINNEIIEQYPLSISSTRSEVLERIPENLKNLQLEADEVILFIDEVPISDEVKFYEFVTGFVTIADRFVNLWGNKRKIRWIVSTRVNPLLHLRKDEGCLPNSQKARRNFHFKELLLWQEDELQSLLALLQAALNFSLSTATASQVIAASKGYPVKIKDTIERMIIENCSIERAIELIKTESY